MWPQLIVLFFDDELNIPSLLSITPWRKKSKMQKKGLFLILSVLSLVLALGLTACNDGSSGPNVTSVTISPASVYVARGGSRTFTAEVAGTASPLPTALQDVTWSLPEGQPGLGTTSISSGGSLMVGSGATATSITVRATSTANRRIWGEATVVVPEQPVTVSPAAASVVRGGTHTFTATTRGLSGSSVSWSIPSGQQGLGNTAISSGGVLTVDVNSTAPSIIVRATSTVNSGWWGEATVTVVPGIPIVTSVTISPAAVSVARGGTHTFTATVAGTNNPSQSVTWSVEGWPTGVTISSSGVLTIGAGVTATSVRVRATSTANSSVWEAATVTVTGIPTVTSVTISPAAVSVARGGTHNFTATVAGTNNPSQDVTWSFPPGQSLGWGTTINSSGGLTVGATAPTSVRVRATSTANTSVWGEATVTVFSPTVTISPAAVSVARGGTHTFSATVTGIDNQNVTWRVTVNPSGSGGVPPGVTINSSGGVVVAGVSTVTSFTVWATSTVGSWEGSATVSVTGSVPSITVSPASVSVARGGTHTFTATVAGANNPSQSVTWSIPSGQTGLGTTSVNSSGVLTVGANSTAPSVRVRATSTANSGLWGEAIVTVTP